MAQGQMHFTLIEDVYPLRQVETRIWIKSSDEDHLDTAFDDSVRT